jgi:hypothetical protein
MDGQPGTEPWISPIRFSVDGKRVLDPKASGKARDWQNHAVSLIAIS